MFWKVFEMVCCSLLDLSCNPLKEMFFQGRHNNTENVTQTHGSSMRESAFGSVHGFREEKEPWYSF